MQTISFTKAEALSNDFVIVDNRHTEIVEFTKLQIIAICDRRLGIGADGILLLQPSSCGDFRMRTFNADGSEAEMCGNGIRCAVKFAHDYDENRQESYTIETLAGAKNVSIKTGDGGLAESIRVDLGRPEIEQLSAEIEVLGHRVDITSVSIGNPHAIIFVENVSAAPVEHLGPAIENHEFFPNKTNVEFIHITGASEIEMRVWERGSGETAACGTGAAAALAAAHSKGRIGRNATLKLKGGDLFVEWAESGNIFITGGANMVFSGTVDVV